MIHTRKKKKNTSRTGRKCRREIGTEANRRHFKIKIRMMRNKRIIKREVKTSTDKRRRVRGRKRPKNDGRRWEIETITIKETEGKSNCKQVE